MSHVAAIHGLAGREVKKRFTNVKTHSLPG